MTMDARKQRVLQAIVALYGLEGEPVGSSVLANYFDMAVSSATLRNEMAALTKLGLLEQPHTSAGRVPSAQGYRYYLDHLIDAPKSGTLPEKDRRRIDDLFAAMDAEPEKLVPAATRCLADMTGCAAAATTPQAPDLCIAHFEVVQVGRYSAAVLAVPSGSPPIPSMPSAQMRGLVLRVRIESCQILWRSSGFSAAACCGAAPSGVCGFCTGRRPMAAARSACLSVRTILPR